VSEAVPDGSPFAGSTYLSFERELRARYPDFQRVAPTAEAVDGWLPILAPDEGSRRHPALDPGLLACCTRDEYQTWLIPKKKAGHRVILSPPPPLKYFHRALLRWLETHGPPPTDAAHGFVPNRSHASHAKLHLGRKVVACIDLANFFGSVTDLHLWVALQGRLPNVTDEALNALIWATTVEVRRVARPFLYTRTWTSQASELIAQYLASRYPDSARLTLALLTKDPLHEGGEARLLESVAHEWTLNPADLYIGFAKSLQLGGGWSIWSQQLVLLLCLITGQVRTVSRRRLIVDVLRLLRLDSWVDDRSRPKSIQSLQQFLNEDLRSRLQQTPSQQVLPSLNTGDAASAWAAAPKIGDRGVRVLPQGAPTSPWLANLAATDLDRRLMDYATRHELVYSRYADDLTFSGDRLPRRFVHDVAVMVQACGFRVNREKIVVKGQHQRQVVTGIIVNDRLAPTTIDRRKLRAMLHALATGRPVHLGDPNNPLNENQLRGHLAYWRMVNPDRVPWPLRDHETGGKG
jgi:hypothetical protein